MVLPYAIEGEVIPPRPRKLEPLNVGDGSNGSLGLSLSSTNGTDSTATTSASTPGVSVADLKRLGGSLLYDVRSGASRWLVVRRHALL